MALNTTSVKFKLVEAASAAAAAKITPAAGQYIVCDTGEAFYDPSPEGASRVALSPDLSGYLKKSFATKVLTDIKMEALVNGLFKCTVSTVDPSTNTTSDAIYIQVKSSTGAVKADVTDDTVDINLNYGEVSADNTTLPVNGASVAAAIKDAQDNAVAETKTAVTVLVVAKGASDTASLATITSPKQGDIAICKHLISGADNYSYTAYIYNNNAWQAMDGNYSAENVYFPEDLLTTSAIGNITLSGGQATIAAEGKNLLDTWQTIFVKETNTGLKTADPSAQYAGNSLKYIQVGSSATETVTMSMKDDGAYKYGYTTETGTAGTAAKTVVNNGTTGVTVDATTPFSLSYKVGSGTAKSITATGTNKNTFVVDSGVQTVKASATITGTMKHGAGHTPVSNLKKMYPAQAIAAGSKSVAAFEIYRWYIPMYHGFKMAGATVANPAAVTAADITSLSKDIDATAYSQTKRTSDAASGSWMQYFIAVPSSYNWNISGAKDGNNLTLDIKKGNKVSITLGTATVEYQVWYINNAAAYDTKNIVITW